MFWSICTFAVPCAVKFLLMQSFSSLLPYLRGRLVWMITLSHLAYLANMIGISYLLLSLRSRRPHPFLPRLHHPRPTVKDVIDIHHPDIANAVLVIILQALKRETKDISESPYT